MQLIMFIGNSHNKTCYIHMNGLGHKDLKKYK